MRSHPPRPTSPAPFGPGPCPYALDDGAYILGALAPAERSDFERHLAACPPCRDSIAQLAVLPGLLGRLDPAVAAPAPSAPPSLLPRVLAAMRAQRAARRRRVLALAAAGVVAAAIAAIVGLGALLTGGPANPPSVVFRPMQVSPSESQVEAHIGLAEQQTGTVVTVRCVYHGDPDRSWEVWLVVYPRDEEAEPIGSWIATGGMPVEISAVTHHPTAEIDRIELRDEDHTLAWWSP